MSEIELEKLEQIKDQAFLEGVVGALTRMKFLIDKEKDPAVAVKNLLQEIDNLGKQCTHEYAIMCLNKLATKLPWVR